MPVGRSILPILEQTDPSGWDRVFASHGFHEIQQYYPMRALRTRQYKYIVNLAAPLEFPIAGGITPSRRLEGCCCPARCRPRRAHAGRHFCIGRRRNSTHLRAHSSEVHNLADDPGAPRRARTPAVGDDGVPARELAIRGCPGRSGRIQVTCTRRLSSGAPTGNAARRRRFQSNHPCGRLTRQSCGPRCCAT